MLLFSQLKLIVKGQAINLDRDEEIRYLLTDSRKARFIKGALFFAIKGVRHDGHQYIQELYKKGIRNFVVEKEIGLPDGANVIKVDNSLNALQAVAIGQRQKFDLPVLGITGSNGKTIVKEWVYKLLSPYMSVVKNPRSYNSQLGVPLSVWNINPNHDLGVFEAGISQKGEMQQLKNIIQPTVGIFTNLGSAHDEGFSSRDEKAQEKARLFQDVEFVIHQKGDPILDKVLKSRGLSWGTNPKSDIRLHVLERGRVQLDYNGKNLLFDLPFKDPISLENVMHGIVFMLKLDFNQAQIQQSLNNLVGVKMRLELKRGVKGSYIIDDSYNNDLVGLQSALDFLKTVGTSNKALVLSDILQSGTAPEVLYRELADTITAAGLTQFVGIGPEISRFSKLFNINSRFYSSTEEALADLHLLELEDHTILIKGARIFHLEKLVKRLEEKNHGTRFEINLDALSNNLNFYRSMLKEGTKLMVMVKAFGYGAGSFDVANLLAYHNVDYLGVAYTDEGVTLREQGIQLPIMVMNPSPESYDKLIAFNLEPEVYSLDQFDNLLYSVKDKIGIHIKLETGMNRLGFSKNDLDGLISRLKANPRIKIKSLFSHLAGADSDKHEAFSKSQVTRFLESADQLKEALDIKPLMHILNSPGITRFSEYQFDMVRLGIGLYGFDANQDNQNALMPVGTFKTVISQVKHLKKDETVGYGRMGKVEEDMKIATIAIGYADGFSRAFSNGVGKVWINGKCASVIGNVCMDMAMIDVTGLTVKEGDEVEIFGQNLPIQEVAKSVNTIPYELLATISGRVKRTYYSE